MGLRKTLLNVLMILQPRLLVGCDYIEEASEVDDFVTWQELQKSKTGVPEKQRKLGKRRIEHSEKQQTAIMNSVKTLAGVVKVVKNKQDEFVFTEFNPTQTQYFILNDGSVGSAGKMLSIDAIENGSVICISLANLLSVPVSNMGLYAI